MASHRKPKGVYSRSTPDWFVENLATAVGDTARIFVAGQSYYDYVSLYNDASDGSSLFVYSLETFNDNSFFIYLSNLHGSLGSSAGQGSSVYFNGPSMPGQIFIQSVATGSGLSSLTPIVGTPIGGMSGGFSSGSGLYPSHPIAIIPPGYSLVTFGDFNANQQATSFWYAVLKS